MCGGVGGFRVYWVSGWVVVGWMVGGFVSGGGVGGGFMEWVVVGCMVGGWLESLWGSAYTHPPMNSYNVKRLII